MAAILLRAVEPYAARCPGHDPEPSSWPRQHLCDLGQSLGQAAARERLFGEAFGPDLPAQQVSAIATHMSDAEAALEAAEAGFQPPFSQQRPADSIRSLLRDMRGYSEWRTGRSPRHRYEEIDGIFGRYQRTLSYTFDSSRPDATHYQPNCDSYTIAACYHLGRASIAAAISPGDRRAVGADTFQSGANEAMTTAIQEGMNVAVDAPREPTTPVVCCSFGSSEAWSAVPRLQPDSPASAYRTAREVVEAAVASASPRNCGGYPGVGGSTVAGTGEGATGSYERGRDLWDEDPRQAYRLVRQAAEAGDERAQLWTGVALFTGHGTASDQAAAADWFRRAAERDNAQAQQNLGQIYISGQGVPRDYEEAVRWTRRAAEQGHPEAQRSLGYAYQIGRGVSRDCDQAVTWYRRAADGGEAMALNDLGYLYENGICVPQDYAAAADWYDRGMAENLPIAITNLAELYEAGHGRPRDEQRALELYRRAARLGHETAQRILRARGLGW